jgi:hypothetical protein
MNTDHWIRHFESNTRNNLQLQLPEAPCTLPDSVRIPLAASLAVFQLGESGSGSRIRRYSKQVGADERFCGYPDAMERFIREEISHSELLSRAVRHLGGKLISKQWTNSAFRTLRFLINLDFTIQMLLTAELVAEVYYGTLYLKCPDAVVRCLAKKILQDETRHLAFQREFFSERLTDFSALERRFWWLQFRWVHALTVHVVAWDHRHALRALGVEPGEFRRRCAKAWQLFRKRLEKLLTGVRDADALRRVAAREADGGLGT